MDSWTMTPCILAHKHQHFAGPCYLHVQGRILSKLKMEAQVYSETSSHIEIINIRSHRTDNLKCKRKFRDLRGKYKRHHEDLGDTGTHAYIHTVHSICI